MPYADFTDLTGQAFERADLTGSRFSSVILNGSRIEHSDLHQVVMRGVELLDVTIDGELQNVVINGIDVAPLIVAEMDRRDPERRHMRPDDADGFRKAWDLVERRWEETVARARAMDADQLHESVDGEWSFIQTLRHLAFASEAWVGRAVLGDPSPWHPLSLPWDQMRATPGVPRDRDARPSLDEALALRNDRMAMVRRVIEGLTDEELDRQTEPQDEPGWPRPGETFPVRECLLVVLNEEWEHRRFAERDLAIIREREAS